MSGRSPTGGRNRHNSDDVESYRQQRRQNDRRHREDEENRRRTEKEERKKQLALDRQKRMARLREEIKKEDETLSALDKQQQEQQQQTEDGEQDKISPQDAIIEVKPEELEGLDQEEQMRRLLGFNGFGSTKGEAVEDNQSTAARGGAAKNKARKYRQYMNRKNGFNRPLEKMK